MTTEQPTPEAIESTFKRSAAALREADVPFLLGGSLAAWARGGPQSRHDLDLMIEPDRAEDALAALDRAGMRTERPPEAWLYKAWDGDVLIDLIFEPSGLDVDEQLIARGEELTVLGVDVRVMAIQDVMVTKLLSLTEHDLNYASSLQIARALRERIDWPDLRNRTAGSPYAAAFFTLVEELDIAPRTEPGGGKVRVLRDVGRSGGS